MILLMNIAPKELIILIVGVVFLKTAFRWGEGCVSGLIGRFTIGVVVVAVLIFPAAILVVLKDKFGVFDGEAFFVGEFSVELESFGLRFSVTHMLKYEI